MNGSQEFLMLEDVPIANRIILTDQKRCTKCKKIRNLNEFYDRKSKSGKVSYCKKCRYQYYLANKEKAHVASSQWKSKHPEKHIFSYYKSGARKRKIEFTVTFAFFEKLLNKPCFYCGDKAKGVDRMDNTKGYEEGNICSCCWRCNWMKREWSQNDFIEQCTKVANKKRRSDGTDNS
jgi:hypothetical protein